jgi:RHS repeat-associated protein
MSRGDGTTTVDYIWDVAGGLPMLLQDGTNTYVYGLGLIAIYDGSEMTYRLVDGLGSTVNLCDEDGELVGEYTYDAYGNVRAQSGAETEFSFAGEQSDPNGLDFLRARYYDPEIGRFLSGDPLGGGYGYAGGNPVNMADPSGLYTEFAGLETVCYTSSCDRVWYRPIYVEVAEPVLTPPAPALYVPPPAPKSAAPKPKVTNVSAQTPAPSDTIFKAEVAVATQQPLADPGYEFQPPLAACAGCIEQEAMYLSGSTDSGAKELLRSLKHKDGPACYGEAWGLGDWMCSPVTIQLPSLDCIAALAREADGLILLNRTGKALNSRLTRPQQVLGAEGTAISLGLAC